MGRKSGAGFYDYEGEGTDYEAGDADDAVTRRLVAVMANEVAKLLETDIADLDTIDEAAERGVYRHSSRPSGCVVTDRRYAQR